MFLDEARLASRIRSPYVVPTLDVVSEGGEIAIVMEYIHGESLETLFKTLSETATERAYPVPPEVPVAVAVSVLGNVLEGLHAAHEARSEQAEPLGIVHRDVSPQNIIVGTDGLGHLIDFGVAKAAGRLQTTRDGQLKGKLAYMAPEQLRGEPVTRRSDVFAASVVLWEILAGKRLFCADDEGATVTRVLMGDVQRPSEAVRRNRDPLEVQAIEGLDAVVMRGLERDPKKRFETARDMAVAIERCLAHASAAEVTRWLEEVAAAPLARRAATIAALEGSTTGVATSWPRREGDAGAPSQPIADASSLSVVSGVTAAPWGPRRRAGLWLAAGAVLLLAIAAARISWRGPVPSRSAAATAPAAVTSSEPAPADSTPAPSSGPRDLEHRGTERSGAAEPCVASKERSFRAAHLGLHAAVHLGRPGEEALQATVSMRRARPRLGAVAAARPRRRRAVDFRPGRRAGRRKTGVRLRRRGRRATAHRRATSRGPRAPPSMLPRGVSCRRAQRLRAVDDRGGRGDADGGPGSARHHRAGRAGRARLGRRRRRGAGSRRQGGRGRSGRARVPVRVGRGRGRTDGAHPGGGEEPRDHDHPRVWVALRRQAPRRAPRCRRLGRHRSALRPGRGRSAASASSRWASGRTSSCPSTPTRASCGARAGTRVRTRRSTLWCSGSKCWAQPPSASARCRLAWPPTRCLLPRHEAAPSLGCADGSN